MQKFFFVYNCTLQRWVAFLTYLPYSTTPHQNCPEYCIRETRKNEIIDRSSCFHQFTSVDLTDEHAIYSRVVLAVVEKFWRTPSHSLTLHNIATPISDRVMPTYRVIPLLCHISVPLFYDAMPTYRVTLPLYHISVLLLYDVMPTHKAIPSLHSVAIPFLYGVMPTYGVMPFSCPVFMLIFSRNWGLKC